MKQILDYNYQRLKTGGLNGLIDFSLPGYKLSTLRDNPDFVQEQKKDATIGLGKIAKYLCGSNFEKASVEFQSLVNRMINGDFSDYASVYEKGIKTTE